MTGALEAPVPVAPAELKSWLTRVRAPAYRKTSLAPSLSLATRSVASLRKATASPLASMDGLSELPLPVTPAEPIEPLTRVVIPARDRYTLVWAGPIWAVTRLVAALRKAT